MSWPPFLHGYVPPPDCHYLRGWIIMSDDGWYWTGGGDLLNQEAAWTRNPRRALVESCSPWTDGQYCVTRGFQRRGRCYEVLLETESRMLPLRHWPRQVDETPSRPAA
jgi:hypothetical protein